MFTNRYSLSFVADCVTIFSSVLPSTLTFPGYEQFRALAPLGVVLFFIAARVFASRLADRRRDAVATAPLPNPEITKLRRLAVVTLALLVALGVSSWNSFHTAHERRQIQLQRDEAVADRDLLNHLLSPDSYLTNGLIEIETQWHDEMRLARNRSEEKLATKRYLDGWPRVQSEIITRAVGSSSLVGVDLYGRKDGTQRIRWIAGSTVGRPGYDLGPESIAGCTMQYPLVAGWEGLNEDTLRIMAISYTHQPLGNFDQGTKRLVLPNHGSCSYYNSGNNEPKRALLCVSIGASDSGRVPNGRGSLCLKAQDSVSLNQHAVIDYLISLARGLAMLDLDLASDPASPKKTAPDSVVPYQESLHGALQHPASSGE